MRSSNRLRQHVQNVKIIEERFTIASWGLSDVRTKLASLNLPSWRCQWEMSMITKSTLPLFVNWHKESEGTSALQLLFVWSWFPIFTSLPQLEISRHFVKSGLSHVWPRQDLADGLFGFLEDGRNLFRTFWPCHIFWGQFDIHDHGWPANSQPLAIREFSKNLCGTCVIQEKLPTKLEPQQKLKSVVCRFYLFWG